MDFSVNSQKKFKREIQQRIREQYRRILPKVRRKVKELFTTEFSRIFYENEVVRALIYGDLIQELGLEEPNQKVAAIKNAIINGLEITTSSKDSISISIKMGDSFFADVLALEAAHQRWTDATGSVIKGPPLPWLEWLITEGDNFIIVDFHYSESITGRSGYAGVMRRGGRWRVPPEYSGTINDNFLTDIFKELGEVIEKKLWQTVRPVLTQDF